MRSTGAIILLCIVVWALPGCSKRDKTCSLGGHIVDSSFVLVANTSLVLYTVDYGDRHGDPVTATPYYAATDHGAAFRVQFDGRNGIDAIELYYADEPQGSTTPLYSTGYTGLHRELDAGVIVARRR